MSTNYELKSIVKQIETLSKLRGELDSKFGLEYLFYNLDEDILIKDLKFEFIGFDSTNQYPLYRLGNIGACFIDNVLHVYVDHL